MSDAPTIPAHAGSADGTGPTGTQPHGVRPGDGSADQRAAVAAHTTPGSPPGAPWVAALRARPGTLVVGGAAADGAALGGPARWTVRVEVPEVWDTVRVSAPPGEPLLGVKVMALAALMPDAAFHDDFVVKLNGAEVRDENAPLSATGARDGSIFVLTSRRRRPVR